MAQISDDSHGYNPWEAVSDRDTPRLGKGCFSTGLAAALGGSCIAMGYTIGSRDHIHGNEIVAPYILVALGLLFVFAAGRNGFRHFGLADTVVILALSVTPGSCIGLTLIPEGHGSVAARRATCQNNLKQMGLVFKMYANDQHDGAFPELSNQPGTLAVRDDEGCRKAYSEFFTDLSALQCPIPQSGGGLCRPTPPQPPAPATIADDRSYLYLGYQIADQQALEKFAVVYRARIASGQPFNEDLTVEGADGSSAVVPRLRYEDTSTFDAARRTEYKLFQSRVSVLIERFPNRHIPDGGIVLYMDGHVEFIKWGEKWPMTPEAMEVLLALDALGDE